MCGCSDPASNSCKQLAAQNPHFSTMLAHITDSSLQEMGKHVAVTMLQGLDL